MIRLFSIICSLFLFIAHAKAQTDVATAVKQINSIKMNSDYISGESTAETEEAAKENARALLEVNIEEWIRSKQKKVENLKGYIAKANNSILEVKTTRGSRYRVFQYVKKSDIMTFDSETEIIAAPIQQEVFQSVITPVKEEDITVEAPGYKPSDKGQRMFTVKTFDEVKPFIMQTKDIRDYGKFSNMPVSGECYLFVYNREGDISAYLMKDSRGYMNVKTGNVDSIENYKGCGAIWFRYNK